MDGGDIGGATAVIRNRKGEARRQRNKGLSLLVCFCGFHKSMVLISAIDNFNCHVSFIGKGTGTNGG
jgi:hypothetical protein